ncbi:unnamed protein product [Acanthoscelides obtectus]|uniref:Transmembrane protein 65 n=1 Tax=Acanthoscelides obtectus TaxID=200917 RepID=A0A9P0KSQ4_ACAOB|nr:unnamed protein product [Acanthoscelides obtectus]CAK1658301.1 Transmembrane protein 65 [Acanthoscelides obtectus]
MAAKLSRTKCLPKLLLKRTSIFSQKTRVTNLAGFFKVDEVHNCKFSVDTTLRGTAGHAETTCTTQGLSKLQAQELILRLNSVERNHLMTALQEYNSKIIKEEYEGQLAASRWRSKYGRPSKLPRLGDVDPTGSYCTFPEDWLKKKMAQSVPKPTSRDLLNISVANSIPFIGFGFLDNFFMLIFGDYIDLYLGSYFCVSTMGAAAMGNTISDILGELPKIVNARFV